MRALVVDDSRMMRAMVSRILVQLGWDVAEAADGATALQWFGNHPAPDALVVDWTMPGITGSDLVRRVRRAPFDFSGRVVMLTAETDEQRQALAESLGVDCYLHKPVQPDQLAAALDEGRPA